MKILIAEDEPISRLVLVSTLKRLGHKVVAAENGLQALEAYRKEYFPVLISDWMMPVMDGPALCSEVRKLPRESYTYIVLLTALEGKSNYLEGMDAGADDFMTKPFDVEQLASRIHVAERIIELQRRVAEGAQELREKNEQMEEELKMAQELQLALLPKQFPSIPAMPRRRKALSSFRAFTIPWLRSAGIFSL